MSFSTLKFGFLSFGHQGFLFLPKRDGTTSSVRSLNLFKTSPLENIVHLATNTGRLLKAGSVFTFQLAVHSLYDFVRFPVQTYR